MHCRMRPYATRTSQTCCDRARFGGIPTAHTPISMEIGRSSGGDLLASIQENQRHLTSLTFPLKTKNCDFRAYNFVTQHFKLLEEKSGVQSSNAVWFVSIQVVFPKYEN